MEEEEIIAGLQRGDPTALNALMDAHVHTVYSLCSAILGIRSPEEDVEECTSDVFFLAWKSIGKYDRHKAALRTWVLMLTKYVALERRRKLLSDIKHLSLSEEMVSGKTEETMFSWVEEREELQAALKTLTVRERELIYRRYFLDQSIDDLTTLYGVSRQAIDTRLWGARKSLQNILAKRNRREMRGNGRESNGC